MFIDLVENLVIKSDYFEFTVSESHYEFSGTRVKLYTSDELFGDVEVWDIPIILNDDYELKIQDDLINPLFRDLMNDAELHTRSTQCLVVN